jgi:hypothetical protein
MVAQPAKWTINSQHGTTFSEIARDETFGDEMLMRRKMLSLWNLGINGIWEMGHARFHRFVGHI